MPHIRVENHNFQIDGKILFCVDEILLFFKFRMKISTQDTKKQQWLFQSLLLKMSVSYRNRTYNRVLGGPRYIHLTKETNAVFPGFFDPLAPAAIIYNSITSVMNYLFLISSDFSDFASLSDPRTRPFFFKTVPPWFYLRRRVLYPAELYGRVWYMIIARQKSNCNPLFIFLR